jgi:DNA repair protein RadC
LKPSKKIADALGASIDDLRDYPRLGPAEGREIVACFALGKRLLNGKREFISVGSLNPNLVHPREVFEPAVRNLAAQIILTHNYPSGNPELSGDDLQMAERVIS